MIVAFFYCSGTGLVIEESPSTLLIPVNIEAKFSCKSDCNYCSGRWYINGSNTLDNNGNPYPEYSDFQFRRMGDGTLTVTVNASVAMNNTKFYCIFRASGDSTESASSETATLLVIPSKFFLPYSQYQNETVKPDNIQNLILIL